MSNNYGETNFGISLDKAFTCLTLLTPFSTGTLSGNWESIGETKTFIVRSYGVEIADYKQGELHPLAKTHSRTTNRHANLVAKAWGF